jgi:hypothetical protein
MRPEMSIHDGRRGRFHVQICVSAAIRSGDERECARKVEELVAVIGRYKHICEQ